jgi:hypothetical protein
MAMDEGGQVAILNDPMMDHALQILTIKRPA